MTVSLGRPTIFSDELATEICTQLAEGNSLRSICEKPEMPNIGTVLRWVLDGKHEEFSKQYEMARDIQADVWADEIIHISNTPQKGVKTKTTSDGKVETQEGDMTEHRKLQIDARKWIAARLKPKKYGDKIESTHVGDANRPIAVAEIAHKW